jgi:UDP-N-acetylmuramoylalanine--D-glutamate ligase
MPPFLPRLLEAPLARPVAVLGDGVSGRGARALLAQVGAETAVYDALGREFTAAAAARHDLVVFSPGFPPDHPWLARARAAGAMAIGELDFGSLFWRGRVLAVTGTNGKTTLVEFLAHALRLAGLAARAAGNIGTPLSQLAAESGGGPGEFAVCEVSSFQAETLTHFRCEALLWTNFAEDHLERHRTMEAYFRAKGTLAARAGAVFAGSSVRSYCKGVAFCDGATPCWIETAGQPADPRLVGTVFEHDPQRENFLLAAAWWRTAGFDPERLLAAARSFQLGRHRLARVADRDGVAYWNDSKATNFHAVEAALGRFDRPVLLIAGGRSKGGDLGGFARRIAPGVRHAFLIGETARALAEACAAAGVACTVSETLEAAVRGAAAAAVPGDHVLLSPGFASFDQFRGYADRGEQFEGLVGNPAASRSIEAAGVPPQSVQTRGNP